MHSSAQYHSYQSNATEEPTITLGAMLDRHKPQAIKKEPKRANQQQELLFEQSHKYQQELQICNYQIETLREHIQSQEKEKEELQSIIVDLKKELASSSRECNKSFQQNQKNKQLLQKLKIDNKSMEMEIEKFRAERKVYFNNVNNIELLKRDIQVKMADKNQVLEDVVAKLKKLERAHSECGNRIQDLERSLRDAEDQKKELKSQVKDTLQKYLASSNISARMEYQLKQINELNKNMKDKIYELERETEELRSRLGYDNENSLSQSNRSNYPNAQRSMIEIQSYMKQILNLLDLKRLEAEKKCKNVDRVKISIECLEKSM